MSDVKFIDGLFVKKPHEKAPDFVIAGGSIHIPKFAEFVKRWKDENPGKEYINFQVKISKNGEYYTQEDTWEPKKSDQPPADFDDDLPF